MSTRSICVLALLVLVAGTGYARQDTYEALKARAEAAKPKDRDKLYAEVSRRAVDLANNFYTAGDIEKAQAAVDDAAAYAEKARDAARSTGKNLKYTEITLRETARKLEEVRKSLNLEDRPYVEAAVQRVQAAHDAVLNQMFGPLAPPKENR